MTFREIFIAYEVVCKRKKKEMIFQANCAGAEIEDENDEKEVKINKNEEELVKKASDQQMKARGFKKWPT